MIDQNTSVRTVVGKVVSNKMDKTIVVEIVRKVKHELYGKYIKRKTKLYAHDQDNSTKMGDVVVIKQSRPLSKTKNWVLVEIVNKSEQLVTE